MNEPDDTQPARPTVLVCTVGGSPAPIRTALASLRPDRVIFLVSDGRDGAPSSRSQVENETLTDHLGGDAGPGLRFADGCPAECQIKEVPADNPDRAFALIEAIIAAESQAGRRVVADYTGGTKSMSSALLIAATASEGTRVQFMQGRRSNLVQVEDGSERPTEPPVHLIMLARDFQTIRSFMARRDYGAALQVVEGLLEQSGGLRKMGAPRSWTKRLARWKTWVELLDLWDRFEHKKALSVAERTGSSDTVFADALEKGGFLERLRALAESSGHPSAVLVEDLWLNAERRAAQARYDDAIARCYRLMEAAAQARLWERHRLNSSRLPDEAVPASMVGEGEKRTDPKTGAVFVQFGLVKTRQLLAHLDPNDDLVTGWGEKNPEWLAQRNKSILAHGFQPLSKRNWSGAVRPWFDDRRQILWEVALERETADQLPDWLP